MRMQQLKNGTVKETKYFLKISNELVRTPGFKDMKTNPNYDKPTKSFLPRKWKI